MKSDVEDTVWSLPLALLMLIYRQHVYFKSGGKGICLSDIEMIDAMSGRSA